jgi:hypothetical protein
MTLTDEQTTTIQRWLGAHWYGRARCPAGHDNGWSVEDSMSFTPGFVADEGGPKIVHEHGFRFVVLTCDLCGYVAFLNAKTLGIWT